MTAIDLEVLVRAIFTEGGDPRAEKYKSTWQRVVAARLADSQDWDRVRRAFGDHGGVRLWQGRVDSAIKESRQKTRMRIVQDGQQHVPFVKHVWDDAPVSSEARCPTGWAFVDDDDVAIHKIVTKVVDDCEVERKIPISYDPLVITNFVRQKFTSEQFLELAWRSDGVWRQCLWPRDTLFSSRKIVDCAAQGLPVGSDNAPAIVEYLRAYEHHNMPHLGHGYCSNATGWLGDDDDLGHHGFLVGEKQIGGNGNRFYYSGKHAFRTSGTFEGWRAAIETSQWPFLKVAMLASLAGPLIGIVSAPNMIVEIVCDTTQGKTVALRFARSAWMSAKTKPPTWFATVNGLEAHVQGLNDMPVFIDDTAEIPESKRKDVLSSAVYMLESGHSKLRSSKDLESRQEITWRSIVLSTGEYALADYVSTGGAAARVFTLYGPPTGASSAATGEKISNMMAELSKHYGHAGPAFVKWLCDNREKWDEFSQRYREEVSRVRKAIEAHFAARNKTDGDGRVVPATMRVAETVAMLELTNELCKEAGVLTWDWRPFKDPVVMDAILAAIEHSARMSNKARLAYEHVVSVALSKRKQWIKWGDTPGSEPEPAGGWLGWRRTRPEIEPKIDEEPAARLLAWFPHQLKTVLEQGGFAFEATVKAWRAQNVLIASKQRLTYRAKYAGTSGVLDAYLLRVSNTQWSPREPAGTDPSSQE